MGKIKIFTDSACDLDQAVLEDLGVTCLPLTVNIEGKECRDRVDITPEEFYQRLPQIKGIPKTSMIPPGVFKDAFAEVLESDPEVEILYLAFASTLSSTYGSACLAKEQLESDRITILNTYGASLGFGLMVTEAAKLAEKNVSMLEMVAHIEEMISRMEYLFIVGNLEMLKRGGRVNTATAIMGDLFSIKLILYIPQGIITPLEKAHGVKKAYKRILEIMEEKGENLAEQTIGISYARNLQGAQTMQKMIEEKFHCKTMLSEIGPVIGAHVGSGTLAFFFLRSHDKM